MQKLALTALAVALASVMAISSGPASAQTYVNRNLIVNPQPYTGPTWGLMRTPGYDQRYVNRYVTTNTDAVVVDDTRYINRAGYTGPTWGLMRTPGYDQRYVNRYVGPVRYVNRGGYTGPTWGLMRPPYYNFY